MLKDDTVHFGEPIPPAVLVACERAAERADCMLVVGTSATVYPAAGFAVDIARRGGCLIEVNPEAERPHRARDDLPARAGRSRTPSSVGTGGGQRTRA